MKEEEQRIAIGEACGFKPHIQEWGCFSPDGGSICMSDASKLECEKWLEKLPDTSWAKKYEVRPIYSQPPDYLNDLNAIHEAEKEAGNNLMNADQWEKYGRELLDIHPSAVILEGGEIDYYDLATLLTSLTARQRCEAFLKTLNLWKD